jgi:hypothetical protein
MDEKLSKSGQRAFFTSESATLFNEKAERFLGYPVSAEHHSF